MNLYLDSGYLNMAKIIEQPYPYIFVFGGRGPGKTFGAFDYVFHHNVKFLFMRRTQTQVDMINKPDFAPYKAVDRYYNMSHITKPISKYNSAIYNESEAGEAEGPPIGYTAALSTISSIRGFDASDIEIVIYDEFIPERHEPKKKHEFEALMNAMETIGRNRELEGEPPLKLIALSNSNDIANPIFVGLNIVGSIYKMKERGNEVITYPQRGIMLVDTVNSPISHRKEDTALYRAAGDGEFKDMAIDSRFHKFSNSTIKPEPIQEYTPMVKVGEITIYKHKSKRQYYVSEHTIGNPPVYGSQDVELKRFCNANNWVYRAYMMDMIIFENHICEILLTRYLY